MLSKVVWLFKVGLWDGLLNIQRIVVVSIIAIVFVLVVAEVMFRYFLKLPLMFVEELVMYGVFWLYMLGAAYAAYERTHIKGEVISVFFKQPGAVCGFKIGAAFVSFGLSCLMSYWSLGTFLWDIKMGVTTIMLFLPVGYSHLSLFVGFSLMAVYFLTELISLIISARKGVACY